jgi:hypothetical protein
VSPGPVLEATIGAVIANATSRAVRGVASVECSCMNVTAREGAISEFWSSCNSEWERNSRISDPLLEIAYSHREKLTRRTETNQTTEKISSVLVHREVEMLMSNEKLRNLPNFLVNGGLIQYC